MRGQTGRFSKRTVLTATIAALLVLVVQTVLRLLSVLLNAMIMLAQSNGQGGLPAAFPGYLVNVILDAFPFALGVFLSLWLLAPIRASLSVRQVIARSLLAVVGGALVVFVVMLAGVYLNHFDESAGYVFGWAAAAISTAVSTFGSGLSYALYAAWGAAIGFLPLTVLAGVLVWLRLREHPLGDARPGASGEV